MSPLNTCLNLFKSLKTVLAIHLELNPSKP